MLSIKGSISTLIVRWSVTLLLLHGFFVHLGLLPVDRGERGQELRVAPRCGGNGARILHGDVVRPGPRCDLGRPHDAPRTPREAFVSARHHLDLAARHHWVTRFACLPWQRAPEPRSNRFDAG